MSATDYIHIAISNSVSDTAELCQNG